MLVGFQREWTKPHIAGIRTITLLTVFGTLCGHLAQEASLWLLPAGLLVVGAMLGVGTFAKFDDDDEPGLTTHAAALLMFLVGAGLIFLPIQVPVLLGGVAAVLLHWKEPLHALVKRVGANDLRAVIQLVLLGLVVLPILPNQAYGPYQVLNPFQIWLMVVLVCGISLVGYVVYRLLGTKVGTLVAGLLGGVISSTATTVSYARRAGQQVQVPAAGALVIMIASTMVFARVFVEVAVVTPGIVWNLAPPLATMMGLMILVSLGLYFYVPKQADPPEFEEDPSELKAALTFGALYAVVLIVVAAAKDHFGDEALFVVAGISGLTDMDAITLSAARFIDDGRISIETGWRMILIGHLSNLVFKIGVIAVLGSRKLLRQILIAFGITITGGVAILLLWP